MRIPLPSRAAIAFVLVALAVAHPAEGQGSRPPRLATVTDTNAVPNALPYTLSFVPVTWNGPAPLPALHSYTWASSNGVWLVLGGRRAQGLHMFNSQGSNFPKDSSNTYIWVIDPVGQFVDSFPVKLLPKSVWPQLASTNQEFGRDPNTGILYIVGGYGWTADGSTMKTFGQITALNPMLVMSMIAAKKGPGVMQGLFPTTTDARFAVTGSDMINVNGVWIMPGGQLFNGQYRPFGGGFTQSYTNQVALFTIKPNSFPPKVVTWNALTTSDTTQPYHRRDGNFIDDINPSTGKPRAAAFGGVFPPGIIGAYTNAIYIDQNGATVDTSLHQRFNQYEAPVISAWDSAGKVVYHTFFGGISGYYYNYSHSQDSVFKLVTSQGRNDGLPFIANASTLVNSASSGYSEWILPGTTTADTALVGASASFIPSDSAIKAGVFTANGHVRLNALTNGQSVRIGWVYGGILAQNPFPVFPSTGTAATNMLQEVWITNTPSSAIPASKGIPAKPSYPPFPHHAAGAKH